MGKAIPDNIQFVVDNMLCSACGGCAGICPVGAIQMQENPAGFISARIDGEKCISCQKCISVCPSNGTRVQPDLIGKVLNGYVGYATNDDIRLQGQSGGIVTALLEWLLTTQQVDAVVVTRFNCKNKRAESFLAASIDDVRASKGSHYTQTSPVELILKNQDKKLAAVLLGCQTACLDGIRKKYPKIQLPILTIGLICGGNLSGYVVEDILQQGRVKDSDALLSFRFRDKSKSGWPGNIELSCSTKHVSLSKEKRMELKPYYQNFRCMLCTEKMNQSSDIVVGDPWGIQLADEAKGYSAIITRTTKGDIVLKAAEQNGVLVLSEADAQNIVEGQKIRTGLEVQLALANRVLAKHGWKSPNKPETLGKTDSQKPYPEALDVKLSYLRRLQTSKTKEEALAVIKQKKKENSHPTRDFLYHIKKALLK